MLERDTTGNIKSNVECFNPEAFVNCAQDTGVKWVVAIYNMRVYNNIKDYISSTQNTVIWLVISYKTRDKQL